jgi:hypothetical protein
MSSKISHAIKKRDKPEDVFYTPETLVKEHLDLVKTFLKDENVLILDPFKGQGAYFNEFNNYFPNCSYEWCEINDNKDFFEYQGNPYAIISNPPYSMIDKVLQKSVSLQPHIISYLVGFGNLTARRMEYMNKNGYELCSMHLTKVFKWYGMSAIITFRKCGGTPQNVIGFDRTIHRSHKTPQKN